MLHLKKCVVDVFSFYTSQDKPSRTTLVCGQEICSEFTPVPHCRISITVSGEQLPFGPSILQIGCQELKSSGNSGSQTRTHPLGKKGGYERYWQGCKLRGAAVVLNAGWAGEERGREGSQTIEFTWERGTGKIVWEMLRRSLFFFFPKSLLFHCYLLEQKPPMQRQKLKTKRPDTYFLISVSNISCDICNSYTRNRNAWTQSSFPGFSENDILFLLASFPHLSVPSAGGLPFPTIVVVVLFSSSHSLTCGNLCPSIRLEPKCHL